MSPAATSDPVLVAGEALVDIVRSPDGSIAEHVGGSPTNVAIGLARLGHPVELATHIGADERGERVGQTLAREQVSLSKGSTSADRTPTAAATLDDSGAATYEFDLSWELSQPADLERFGHLHTGSIAAVLEPGGTNVLALVQQARSGHTVSYDPNSRPSLMGDPHDVRAKVEALIGLSDVVKASEEDVEWLYPGHEIAEVVRLWGRLGPSVVVVTRSGQGAVVAVGANGQAQAIPAYPTTVVDTVGAGDSFMSGLISGLLDARLLGRAPTRERLRAASQDQVLPAVRRALACGAITVSRAGANPPTRAEI